jgi:cyclase
VENVTIPVIACGGASSLNDFRLARKEAGVAAVAAGSFFVFHGKHRAVLITYPKYEELERLFGEENSENYE